MSLNAIAFSLIPPRLQSFPFGGRETRAKTPAAKQPDQKPRGRGEKAGMEAQKRGRASIRGGGERSPQTAEKGQIPTEGAELTDLQISGCKIASNQPTSVSRSEGLA